MKNTMYKVYVTDFSNLCNREKGDFGVLNVLKCQLMWWRKQVAETEEELLIIRKNLYQFCFCKITRRFVWLIIIICKAPKNFLNETFKRAHSCSCALNQMYRRNTDKMFSRGQNNKKYFTSNFRKSKYIGKRFRTAFTQQ